MTQVIYAPLRGWQKRFDRIGFRRKGHHAHMEDLKACCAKLRRMDLYHAAAAGRHSVRVLSRLSGMAAAVCAGRLDIAVLESYVGKLAAATKRPVGVPGNARYERLARNSRGRSTLAASPNTCRARVADAALALPDLFPDDGEGGARSD